MATRIVKSQSLYPIFSFSIFIIVFILSFVNFVFFQSVLSIVICCFIVVGIFFYIQHIMRLKKQLNILIEASQNIIDNKPLEQPLIDGESYIAVLYSSLSILDTRMQGMVKRLKQEQLNLKTYIEDISHQIKTPLTSMILREEMLMEIMEESKEKEILTQIYKQSEKIKELTELLLHLAQVDSHSIEYNKKEYNLGDIIEHIEETLMPLKEKYNVDFYFDHLDYNIYCDEKWFSEALENILKNCIEQRENSKINIYCKNYHSFIELYIQDYGEGFSKDDINHIFERFYQGKSKQGKGIGIGLALSKGIIEGHHGSIEVRNNEGALFKITLPHKNTKSKFTVTN